MTIAPDEQVFRASIATRPRDADVGRRLEADSLGPIEVPANAYWGAHTARALQNFAITGHSIASYPDLIQAFARVKQAAARANAEMGVLPAERAALIDAAAQEIASGALLDQFVVDIIQGGAGTSTNMNVNEVIANRGLELGGYARGDYVHLSPLDDVNSGQSTNDTYPTALKLALCIALQRLLTELERLAEAFDAKGQEFAQTLKVGRTQLQDAVPMTLGQEFTGFAATLREDGRALNALFPVLQQITMGATAVGTGITAPAGFAEATRQHLAELTGFDLQTAPHLVSATSDMGVFMQLSGGLKRSAMNLSKICNDLRLLSSGPQFGFGEINLPPRQAGSSIMPGKVNPVIPEVVNQVAFLVAGADVTVAMACEGGQLQLNPFGPVVASSLLSTLKWFTAATITLREHCITGITANHDRLAAQTTSFVGTVTAFTPYIGYAAAADIAKQALSQQSSIADLIVDAGLMTRDDVLLVLDPARLSGEDPSPPPLSRSYARPLADPVPRE